MIKLKIIHYRYREIPELDLIQEGTFGLIKALEKYDLNTNYKFSTYAYSWIKQFIDRFLLTKGRNIYITGSASIINNIDLYFQENFPDKKCEILTPFFASKSNLKINIKENQHMKKYLI